MKSAPEHPQEQQRLSTLFSYQVMDSAAEQALDELTELASAICGKRFPGVHLSVGWMFSTSPAPIVTAKSH